MASKKAIVKETAAPAKPARVVKSATPRVPSARHTKSKSVDSVAEIPAKAAVSVEKVIEVAKVVEVVKSHETVARLAYSYWESRGYQHGDQMQDWLRAEEELRSASAVA